MGPGLAARFSWICLLLISNAASVPVQHKYHPRPLYKSSAGPALPPEGLRPSLMTLQNQHSKVYPAVQDSDPTPESQPPSSPSTPGVVSSGYANQRFVAYAGNSDKPSSAPSPRANEYASAPSSGSRWALYDQASSYKPTNAGDQVGMANPGVQQHRSWVLQSSGDKTSTGGLKLDAVKGQPAVNGGGNLPPTWAEYISMYAPPSSYVPPTASLPVSVGVKVSNPQANQPIGWTVYHPVDVQPSGHKRPSLGQVDAVKGQLMETPAAGVPSSWALLNQVFTSNGYESPNAPESPVTAKEPAAANPGGYVKGWQVYSPVYVQPLSYKPSTGSVDTVKGQQASHPSGTKQKSWTAYTSVEPQPSSSKPATGGLVQGQPASSPGAHLQQEGWSAYSEVYPPTGPVVAPGTGKGQQTPQPGGALQQSWAAYSEVYPPPTAPVVPPGPMKGQQTSHPGGTMQKSWTAYGPVEAQPSSSKPTTGGLVKYQSVSSPGAHLQQNWAAYGEVYPQSSFKPPTAPGGTMQKSWTAYGSVEAQPSSSKPATGGFVKGQSASSPGDHLQQNWAAYGEVYPPSSFKPPTAPGGPMQKSWTAYGLVEAQPSSSKPTTGGLVKYPSVSSPGAHLQQNWAAYSEIYPPSSFKPPTAPGGPMQKSWTAYGLVEAQPSSSKPTTGGLVKYPSVSSPGAHLQQNWAAYGEVYPQSSFKPPTAPGGTMQKSWTAYGSVEAQPSSSKPATGGFVEGQSASSPGDHLQQNWAAYGEVYPQSSFKPPTAPGGTMQKSWTAYGPVEAQPSSSKPATGGFVKGQSASSPGDHLQQNWAAYGEVYPPSSFKPQTAPVVPPGPVNGQWASHPRRTMQQNWAAYSETYPPTDPVVLPGTVKGQQTSHPGATLEQSETAYSSVEAQHPSSKLTTGGVVEGQPAPSQSADLRPSWMAYRKVYEPLTAPLVPPGGVKGSPHITVKGQQAVIQSGNLPSGWVHYSPVNVKPATGSMKVNLAKGQPAVNPADNRLPSWVLFNPVFTSSGFESPTAPESPVVAKGQPAANPGDKSWAVYTSGHVHPPNYKPSAGGVKQQPVVNTGELLPNWAAYSQVHHPPTALDSVRGQLAFNPVGTPQQQSWASYSSVGVQPSSSKHETGLRKVDPVKGQRTVNPVASLPPNWAMFNPGYLSSSDSEFPTAPVVSAGPVDPGRRQASVGGNQPQSWVLGHPMYEPAAPESSVPGKDQPSAKPYGKLHKGWAMYSPVVVRPSTYKPSTGVDAVQGNLPPHWTAYSQVYHPPASPVVSPPSTVTEQLASHPGGNLQQRWAVYTSGTGMGQTPGWVKVAVPAAKGPHAFSEANLALTGGAKGHTGKGQPTPHPDGNLHPNWAAYSQVNLPSEPAAPSIKAPSVIGVLVRPSIIKGKPAATPGGNQHPKWTSHSSAHYWSPGFNPSVAPVPSPVGAHVSLPAGAGNWGAGSVSGAKLDSGWAAYGQINNPSSNYKPSRAPGSGHQSSQGAANQVSGSLSSGGVQVRSRNKLPAHPVGLVANWPYLQVDSNHHATSGLKGYDSASVPNRSPLKWISYHPGQDLVRIPMKASAPWLSSQVFTDELPEEEDDDDDYEEEELPTYIVQNRNGYQQPRKEFSRMHYFQKDEQPYVPYLRRSPKV